MATYTDKEDIEGSPELVFSKDDVSIPKPEMVLIDDIKTDCRNPNRMTQEQTAALAENIKRFGFIVPIVTNNDLLVADGEQRLQAARSLNMAMVPVVRLPIKDVDRRILRQVLNKLKGTHDPELDAAEFKLLLEDGAEEDIKALLAMSDDELKGLLQDFQPIPFDKDTRLDMKAMVKCPGCGHEFYP